MIVSLEICAWKGIVLAEDDNPSLARNVALHKALQQSLLVGTSLIALPVTDLVYEIR